MVCKMYAVISSLIYIFQQGYLLVADVGVGKVAEASYKDAARSTAGLDADSLSVSNMRNVNKWYLIIKLLV